MKCHTWRVVWSMLPGSEQVLCAECGQVILNRDKAVLCGHLSFSELKDLCTRTCMAHFAPHSGGAVAEDKQIRAMLTAAKLAAVVGAVK